MPKYMINNDGELIESEKGADTIEDALASRVDELKCLVPPYRELELDYDEDDDVWYAMKYDMEAEAAFNLENDDGEHIVAVKGGSHENGIEYSTVDYCLLGFNVMYVS